MHIKRKAGRIARMGRRRGVCRVLVGKPEEKRPLGIPTCRWENDIKIYLKEK
jgi:ferredoxin-thioredoxin reductase catalytic subunit